MNYWLFCAATLLVATRATAASPLEGSWTNPARNVTVKIEMCGQRLCGRVTSASPHARAKAARAGTEQLVGTELMSGIERTGSNSWRASIFVPDVNLHAGGEIRLNGSSEMWLRGCAFARLICKSQMWARVSAPAIRGT